MKLVKSLMTYKWLYAIVNVVLVDFVLLLDAVLDLDKITIIAFGGIPDTVAVDLDIVLDLVLRVVLVTFSDLLEILGATKGVLVNFLVLLDMILLILLDNSSVV